MRALLLFLLVAGICTACGPSSEELAAEVNLLSDSLQMTSRRDSSYELLSQQLIEAQTNFAQSFPQDSLSPVYLMRAADLSRATGNAQEAVNLWQLVVDKYPDFDRAPEALFLIGVTYDKFLDQEQEAMQAYERFLETYPSHSFSEDVQLMKELIEPAN